METRGRSQRKSKPSPTKKATPVHDLDSAVPPLATQTRGADNRAAVPIRPSGSHNRRRSRSASKSKVAVQAKEQQVKGKGKQPITGSTGSATSRECKRQRRTSPPPHSTHRRSRERGTSDVLAKSALSNSNNSTRRSTRHRAKQSVHFGDTPTMNEDNNTTTTTGGSSNSVGDTSVSSSRRRSGSGGSSSTTTPTTPTTTTTTTATVASATTKNANDKDKSSGSNSGSRPSSARSDSVSSGGSTGGGGGGGGGMDAASALENLLRRIGGGGGLEDFLPQPGRYRTILAALQDEEGDGEMRQLSALSELCESLSMAVEDMMGGFNPSAFAPVLTQLLIAEHNPNMMLLAARAMSNMMDVMPRSAAAVVRAGAVPILCTKLLAIEYIDLAEQALQALDKVAQEHAGAILKQGGLMAVLAYLDFFPVGIQRMCVSIAAQMCRHISTDDYDMVRQQMQPLGNLLTYGDQKIVEQATMCIYRICEAFAQPSSVQQLNILMTEGLLKNAVKLMSNDSEVAVSPSVYTHLVRALYIACRASPSIVKTLLSTDVVQVLNSVLQPSSPATPGASGSGSGSASNVSGTTARAGAHTPQRTSSHLFELLSLANMLLPHLESADGHNLGKTGRPPKMLSRVRQPEQAKEADLAAEKARLEQDAAERRAIIEEHPELLQSYATCLFPSLIQLFTATVNINVRQKCLSAITKVIHFSSADMLSSVLKDQPVSRFVSKLLSSGDDKIVMAAIYLAREMLSKLPDIFRKHFVKEGVVFELSRLSNDGEGPTAAASSLPSALGLGISPLAAGQPGPAPHTPFTPDTTTTTTTDGEGTGSGKGNSSAVSEGAGSAASKKNTPAAAAAAGAAAASASKAAPTVRSLAKELVDEFFADTLKDGGSAEDQSPILSKLLALSSDLNKWLHDPQDPLAAPSAQRATLVSIGRALQDADEHVSAFEFLQSHIVDSLVTYLQSLALDPSVSVKEATQARYQRVCLFTDVFYTSSSVPTPPIAAMLERTQAALELVDEFRVVSHEVAGSTGSSPAAALKALNQPIKLRLQAQQDAEDPVQGFGTSVVLTEPLASINAIEDFVWSRVREHQVDVEARARRVAAMKKKAEAKKSEAGKGKGKAAAGSSAAGSAAGTHGTSTALSKGKTGATTTTTTTTAAAGSSSKATSDAQDKEEEKDKPSDTQPSSHKHDGGDGDRMHDEEEDDDEEEEHDDDDEGMFMDEEEEMMDTYDDDHMMMGDEDDYMMGEEDEYYDDEEDDQEIDSEGEEDVRASFFQRGSSHRDSTDARDIDTSRNSRMSLELGSGGRTSTGAGAGPSTPSRTATAAQLAAAQDHHLVFCLNGRPIPYKQSIFQAIHAANSRLPAGAAGTGDAISRLWDRVHTLTFRRLTPDDYDAVLTEGGTAPAGAASPKSPSISSPTVAPAGPSLSALWPTSDGFPKKCPEAVTRILTLLHIVHGINDNLSLFSGDHTASGQADAGATSSCSSSSKSAPAQPVPAAAFLNQQLSAKLGRQLHDPLTVCSSTIPAWIHTLLRTTPFLFPFDLRRLYLQATAFGLARAVKYLAPRWSAHDDKFKRGRISREKVRISRDRMLESAMKVMVTLSSFRSVLEVEYFGEAGTGLGPTLEFYSEVSRLVQSADLGLWRSDEPQDPPLKSSAAVSTPTTTTTTTTMSDGDKNATVKSQEVVEYVFSKTGLFPLPNKNPGEKGKSQRHSVLSYFEFLGTFVAKALMDGRLLDLPLSPLFYARVAHNRVLTLADMPALDPALAASLQRLKAVADQREAVLANRTMSTADKNTAIAALTLDGAPISALSLDFTLPGNPGYELAPDGAAIDVTIDNLASYIDAVVDAVLRSGVDLQLQAFVTGFTKVLPITALQPFASTEVEMLLCGQGQDETAWDKATLSAAIVCDHGYAVSSRAIQNLFDVMSSFTPEERSLFVRFITGCPRLPIGGFKNLTPRLTVVRKTTEGDQDCNLPSVMTCANYLKLPDYSSAEVMKERLLVAMTECQNSFHLS